MKTGIRKLRYIPVEKTGDFSMFQPGSVINLSSFLDGDLSELPFTPETADLTESWQYDENGKYSEASFSAEIRADREKYRQILQNLAGRKHIFEVERVDGVKCIFGSYEFPPTFTYGDALSGNTKSAFSIKISLRSLHGILFNGN